MAQGYEKALNLGNKGLVGEWQARQGWRYKAEFRSCEDINFPVWLQSITDVVDELM